MSRSSGVASTSAVASCSASSAVESSPSVPWARASSAHAVGVLGLERHGALGAGLQRHVVGLVDRVDEQREVVLGQRAEPGARGGVTAEQVLAGGARRSGARRRVERRAPRCSALRAFSSRPVAASAWASGTSSERRRSRWSRCAAAYQRAAIAGGAPGGLDEHGDRLLVARLRAVFEVVRALLRRPVRERIGGARVGGEPPARAGGARRRRGARSGGGSGSGGPSRCRSPAATPRRAPPGPPRGPRRRARDRGPPRRPRRRTRARARARSGGELLRTEPRSPARRRGVAGELEQVERVAAAEALQRRPVPGRLLGASGASGRSISRPWRAAASSARNSAAGKRR